MKRRQIDPKTLRKHSRIVEHAQEPVVTVAGVRDQTDYGYVIEGHKGKSFETKYICIMPHAMTPKWQHNKKTRVIRVTSGIGHYESVVNDDVTVKLITAGDEVVIAPGTAYRIRSGPTKLEFLVTQDAKYEASLNELEPVEASVPVPASELQSVSQADKTHQTSVVLTTDRSMRRNRAREQLEAQRSQVDRPSRRPGERSPTSEEDFFRNGAAQNFNAMPVADFDPNGAG